jgi:hypothetical protein
MAFFSSLLTVVEDVGGGLIGAQHIHDPTNGGGGGDKPTKPPPIDFKPIIQAMTYVGIGLAGLMIVSTVLSK